MKVRATQFGFYRSKRKVGDVFEFEGKPSGRWMEPVDDAARKAFKKAGIPFTVPAEPPPAEKKAADPGDEKGPGGVGPTGGNEGGTGNKNVI
jgi:hypothetical protein